MALSYNYKGKGPVMPYAKGGDVITASRAPEDARRIPRLRSRTIQKARAARCLRLR
jgi:hypothetical protein